MIDPIDLRDIASDFRLAAASLTQLLQRLEKVVLAADGPVDLTAMDTLYYVRDAALTSHRKLTELVNHLEKSHGR